MCHHPPWGPQHLLSRTWLHLRGRHLLNSMPLHTHLISSIHCQAAHPLLSTLSRVMSLSRWTQLTACSTIPRRLALVRLLCRQRTALQACLVPQLLAA